MDFRNFKNSILIIFSFGITACVGPTSPFGAINQLTVFTKNSERDPAQDRYQVQFSPSRQLYHDKTDFSIEIQSTKFIPEDLQVRVMHNQYDVTRSFLKSARVHNSADFKRRYYVIPNFRLKALDPNQITVQIYHDQKRILTRDYQSPHCLLTETRHYTPASHFRSATPYLRMIQSIAEHEKTNPALLGALVTQESGFDPQAVSFAKAIGLTQVTPLAEEQIFSKIETWPRFPGIKDMSYLAIRSKIAMGEMRADNDWRLDPEKSLIGGLSYLQYLQKYWSLETNKALIDKLQGDPDQILTDLVLASYNSGPARVRQAVVTRGGMWKQHEKLKSALRYLRKVKSYCYHYSKDEVEDDNET